MIGGLPESTARGIAEAAVHAVEAVAILSLMCAVGAGTCLLLARRSTGGRAVVFRWLAALLAVAALVPPVLVAWAIGH